MSRGPMSAVQPVTTPSYPRVGSAYLLRGFIGIFSTGIDNLGEQINATGIHAQVFQDDQWSTLADQIAKEYHGKQAEPLILIGHSYGADDVVRIARRLDEANVPVDLLITLDPVTPPDVPKNVKLCVDLYQSNGVWDKFPWLRGVPMEKEKDDQGILVNSNLRTDRTDLLEPNTDHFNIEKNSKIHQEVIKMVLAQCPSRAQWAASHTNASPMPSVPTAVKEDGNKPIAANASGEEKPLGN